VQFVYYLGAPFLCAEIGVYIAADLVNVDDLVPVAAQNLDGLFADSFRTAGNGVNAHFSS
jgi:hypothetical protein